MREVNSQVARRLWAGAVATGAFAAVAAGWQVLGDVGPEQFAFAGVSALIGGALTWFQADSTERPSTQRHPVPRKLPRDTADFTGRAPELAQLDDLLRTRDRSTGPLVAISRPSAVARGISTRPVRCSGGRGRSSTDSETDEPRHWPDVASPRPSSTTATWTRRRPRSAQAWNRPGNCTTAGARPGHRRDWAAWRPPAARPPRRCAGSRRPRRSPRRPTTTFSAVNCPTTSLRCVGRGRVGPRDSGPRGTGVEPITRSGGRLIRTAAGRPLARAAGMLS